MQLNAYLYFDGRCEEALEFYKSVLGGEYELTRYAGSPAESMASPAWGQKILHATFTGDGLTFMASDRSEGESAGAPNPNVALSLAVADPAKAEVLFGKLSDGGNVTVPLGKAFWGGTFGMLVDRFGIEWMVSGHEG